MLIVGLEALNLRQTLAIFLLSLYDGPHSIKDVLAEIGMRELTDNQIVCLSELPLVHLYHCLKMFARWMEQGMYDFSALPYTLKAHLHPNDLATLKAIPENWEGEAHSATAYNLVLYCTFYIVPCST